MAETVYQIAKRGQADALAATRKEARPGQLLQSRRRRPNRRAVDRRRPDLQEHDLQANRRGRRKAWGADPCRGNRALRTEVILRTMNGPATNTEDLTLLDRGRLAKLLGVSPRTIDRWKAAGILPPPRIASRRKCYWTIPQIQRWQEKPTSTTSP